MKEEYYRFKVKPWTATRLRRKRPSFRLLGPVTFPIFIRHDVSRGAFVRFLIPVPSLTPNESGRKRGAKENFFPSKLAHFYLRLSQPHILLNLQQPSRLASKPPRWFSFFYNSFFLCFLQLAKASSKFPFECNGDSRTNDGQYRW